MAELTCQQCREVAAELALDVLPCHERADALAHMERCASCQDAVSALAGTADRLVELLPAAEPPAGFEQRVITALAPPAPRGRRRWRILAAAGLVAVALAGGWIFGYSDGNDAPADVDARAGERTVMYAPLTTAQHQVGNAYVYPGTPSWIYLSLDGGTASNTVHCDVVRQDGSAVRVGSFPLNHGHGAWGGPAPVDQNTLATARLTDGRGDTLATARFGSPPHKSDRSGSHSHPNHRHSQRPR